MKYEKKMEDWGGHLCMRGGGVEVLSTQLHFSNGVHVKDHFILYMVKTGIVFSTKYKCKMAWLIMFISCLTLLQYNIYDDI